VYEVDRGAGFGQAPDFLRGLPGYGQVKIIISNPVLEKVAKYVERICVPGNRF